MAELTPNAHTALTHSTAGLRILRWTLAALCVTLAATQVCAQDSLRPVRLRAYGRAVDVHSPVLATAYEVYVPIEALANLGIQTHLSDNGDSVRVSMSNPSRQGELAIARPNGEPMIALSDLARLENSVVVRPDTSGAYVRPNLQKLGDTVYLLARITDAHFADGILHISTSVPIAYRVHMLRDMSPARGYVDCVGAWVGDDFKPTPIVADTRAVRLRSGQNTEEIARVVVELNRGVRLTGVDSARNQSTEIAATVEGVGTSGGPPTIAARPVQPLSGSSSVAPVPPISTPGRDDDHDTPDGADPGKPAPAVAHRTSARPDGPPIEVRAVTVRNDDDGSTNIVISTSARAISYERYEQDGRQLVVDVSNATMNLSDPGSSMVAVGGALLSSVQTAAAQENPPVVRVTMDMKRVVGFTVDTTDNAIQIALRRPVNATGSLSSKVIVVDAGHGGTSTGAVGKGDTVVYEKDVTLAISLKLRDSLEALGAKVVMTRDKDVNVALGDRPKLANDIHADLFVSIHNDSNGVPNSASGTSTYYHMQDPNCRALATCVQHEILKVSDLPSRGVLSDSVMYQHGFAVLRESRMPAILVEVAYINNARDRRRLLDPSFQESVAKAVCAGLRVYVEGSDQTARNQTTVQPASLKVPEGTDSQQGDSQR